MDITGIFSEAFWYIAPILVTMTTFLAGLFNQGVVEKFVPEQHRAWLKQLVAWVFGACLSCAAWGIGVISFGAPVWVGVIALCAVVGLSSNGVYDIEFIHKWIDNWFKVAAVLPIAKEAETVEEFVESTATKKEEKPLKVKVRKTKVLKDDAEQDAPDVKA